MKATALVPVIPVGAALVLIREWDLVPTRSAGGVRAGIVGMFVATGSRGVVGFWLAGRLLRLRGVSLSVPDADGIGA